MSFIRQGHSLLRYDFASSLNRLAVAAFGAALALTLLTSYPAYADDQETAAKTENDESSAMSAREMRRAARRQAREEANREEANGQPEVSRPAVDLAGNPVTGDRPVVLVAVEPEIECERIQVVGSRMPREVCRPVSQIAAEEDEAKEFLRRTREGSTLTVPCPAVNPSLPGPAASFC